MDTDVVIRHAARVVLLDRDGRVLLFRGWDPHDVQRGTWWITPGGGLDPGEAPAAGAARELFEETGLALPPEQLSGPIHERVAEFSFESQQYRQMEQFFLARVDHWDVDTGGFTEVEQRSVDVHRWWTPAELRATTETVYPEQLAELIARWTTRLRG